MWKPVDFGDLWQLRSHFLITSQAFRPTTLLKRDSQVFFQEFCEVFKNSFFTEPLVDCFLQLFITLLELFIKFADQKNPDSPCFLLLFKYLISRKALTTFAGFAFLWLSHFTASFIEHLTRYISPWSVKVLIN